MQPRFLPRLPRVVIAGACLAALSLCSAALASGGKSSDEKPPTASGNTGTDKADDLTTCPAKQMWNAKRKRCVTMRRGALSDEETADYAYALAKADRYGEALSVLDLMKDGNTAEALNYRGYATRKLGRTDEGIGYYLRSVELDPKYPKVREYLGEAYVIQGRLEDAKAQLATIKTLCGSTCEPYRDLAEAIEKARPL